MSDKPVSVTHMASCPYCGQPSPHAVRIREKAWEDRIKIAKTVHTAVAMHQYIANHAYHWTQASEEAATYYKKQLKLSGVNMNECE